LVNPDPQAWFLVNHDPQAWFLVNHDPQAWFWSILIHKPGFGQS
jgi:hypothetical protein